MADVIQRLRELRQSSTSSVVSGAEKSLSPDRTALNHPLEDWLLKLIRAQLKAPGADQLSLIALAGNAGDGKSYLLRALRQNLAGEAGLDPGMVEWVLDA